MAHGDILRRQLAAVLVFLATGAAIIAAGVTLQNAHERAAFSQAPVSDN